MKLPEPALGLVVRYAFLWRREFESGHEEGVKDRPCAVVLATRTVQDESHVYVLPITHTPPSDPKVAIEVPQTVKRALELDGERSWIILDEINDFIWPGFDLRAVPGRDRVEYGFLPPRFFDEIQAAFLALFRERRIRPVKRD